MANRDEITCLSSVPEYMPALASTRAQALLTARSV
jgi:hypothetical protein